MDTDKKPYSWLQKVFWLIAGSEISALKKCPNDYNRHANIGLMILITSLFAALTAFIAGSTFAEGNYLGISIFAVVWGMVIFSLDRSMVNSIKKKPGEDKKFNWGYFWPRLVLACILSFFMSIPLDHVVFKERIEYQMSFNKHKDWKDRTSSLHSGYNIKGDSLALSKVEEEEKELNQAIESGCSSCTVEEYKRNVNKANSIINTELPPLEQKLNVVRNKYNSHKEKLRRVQTPIGEPLIPYKQIVADNTLVGMKRDMNNAAFSVQQKRTELQNCNNKAQVICTAWLNDKKKEKQRVDTTLAKLDNKLNKNKQQLTKESGEFKSMLDKMNGFDTQFVTLFLMPNWGVQILKWLIFLALLVIEILPTYLKLKTPFGQYDWQMHRREVLTEIEVSENIKQSEIGTKAKEEYRRIKEIQLNKDLIDKVAIIEEKLANNMLEQWEKNANEKIERDVNNTIS
jgi:hypothetical protein